MIDIRYCPDTGLYDIAGLTHDDLRLLLRAVQTAHLPDRRRLYGLCQKISLCD